MDAHQLAEEVRAQRATVLPFAGAGLTLDAGAPSSARLTADLVRRFEPAVGERAPLGVVTKWIAKEAGLPALQTAIAEIFSGLRMQPTPALIALAACPRGVVVTTNYDDAIEVSVRARGMKPVTLMRWDRELLDPAAPGTVHVVHLHGIFDRPDTIVLPGTKMDELADDSVFETYVRSMLIPRRVLYLGFGFGATETHLRGIVGWIAARVGDRLPQWLLLGERQLRDRRSDFELFEANEAVELVPYDDSAGHAAAEHVALGLAPRSYDRDPGIEHRLTFVQPVMLAAGGEEDAENVDRRIASFDFGFHEREQPIDPVSLRERPRTLIVAAQGMGKSKLMTWLPWLLERPCASGTIADFRPAGAGAPPQSAILRLLRDPGSGERLTVEMWGGDGLCVLLDELDELEPALRPDAVEAIVGAAEALPQHRFIVASRPVETLARLRDAEFETVHILGSRRWAEKYLETRAVPRQLVDEAMLGGYGLGDLLTIPLFAELLADRLLDGRDAPVESLELLVGSQREAVGREARRSRVATGPLIAWMRRLAVGLQLRGLSSAPLAQLRDLAPAAGSTEEARERLVHASVFGDVAATAVFGRRTLQEALVADAIVASTDSAAALRWCGVAEVLGRDRLRADLRFVTDLVFEHADRAARARLRQLDEQRWARTVLTRGTREDADEALTVLERRHAERGTDFLSVWRSSGLRSASEAAVAIVRRWPALVEARRERLLDELDGGAPDARARALALLGALAVDDKTTDAWLLPLLGDDDARIAARAAAVAGRLRRKAAVPKLLRLLMAADESLRNTALAVLVELLPAERLDELAGAPPGSDPLRRVHTRLGERIGLETGLRLVAATREMTPTTAWLLNRLATGFGPFAWTEERVAMLMRACADGGGAEPDYAALAAVVARHPQAAAGAVRPHRIVVEGQAEWAGPRIALRVLLRLPADMLDGVELPEGLPAALERERQLETEEAARACAHFRRQQALEAAIDADGPGVSLERLLDLADLRQLDEARRRVLARAVARHLPDGGDWDPEDPGLITAAHVGVEIAMPLAPGTWRRLLDAHLRAPYRFDLGDDRIVWWLATTRPADADAEMAHRIAQAQDGRAVGTLLAIAGGDAGDSALGAAHATLEELGPAAHEWASAAGELARRDPQRARLLLPQADDAARRRLLGELADAGDDDARAAVLRDLTGEVRAGRRIEFHTWVEPSADPGVLDAYVEFAVAAADAGETGVLRRAVGALTAVTDAGAARRLEAMARSRRELAWIAEEADDVAERCATALVLARLPDDVVTAAAAFEASNPPSDRLG
jgi:hypothetical protein